MAAEWLTLSLDSVYEFSSGLSKPRSDFGSGSPFLSFRDVFYNTFVPRELTELVNSTEDEQEECSIRRGDVFLTRTSETMDDLGMSSVALMDVPGGTFNGFTKRLRPRPGVVVLPEYAAYFFRSPMFRRDVTAMSTLSTRASLNNEMLARLSIVVPPIEEQGRIGRILKALDDKIEVNRRMSATLEAMARALFKSWFVDFDPVRDKAEGRDPGLPKPIADLFPDSFEASELGNIPRGWAVRTLGDVAEHPRRTIGADEIPPDTPYIALEHMPRRSIALAYWTTADGLESNKFLFKKGDILFGKLRPYFHKVGVAPVDGVCSTDIVVIAPKSQEWLGFVLGHTSSAEFVERTSAASTGTKMPRTNWRDMAGYQLVVPAPDLAAAFNELVVPSVGRIIASAHESLALTALRDALLPRLISGELRARDADKLASGAM